MTVKPLNLQISPESLNQGEQAIRQEIAVQLYAKKIFTFGQARHLANLSVWEFPKLLADKEVAQEFGLQVIGTIRSKLNK
jgi:predicted HTH domain antitoxin